MTNIRDWYIIILSNKKKEGFMKENILIAIGVLLIASMWIQFSQQNTNDRYAVVTGNNMLTVMVDKKTGTTWRNCVCNEKSPVPGCWEKMNIVNPEPYNQTIGEAKLTKKLMKKAPKQEQTQPNTTVIAPNQGQQ